MTEEMTKVIETIKESVRPLMEQWKQDVLVKYQEDSDEYRRLKEEDSEELYYTVRVLNRFTKEVKEHTYKKFFAEYMVDKGWAKAYISASNLKEFVEKQAEMKMEKIDKAVYKKLKDFEVETVENTYLNHGKDGFVEGAWLLNGEKTFSFRTIYAGGYNIQALHVRTLYKFK